MKPIAVVTNSIPATIQWLKKHYGVDRVQHSTKLATNTKTGQDYVLVLKKDDALGWEFSGYIVSPYYESLEQLVQSRVR